MKKKLLFGTAIGLITLTANGVIYSSNRDSMSADSLPPIVKQVEDHEQRITGLEDTTEEIKQDVSDTKTQVKDVQDRTKIIEKKVETPAPAPAPIPTPHVPAEGEIVYVKKYPTSLEGYDGNDPRWTPNAWGCTYSINTVTIYKIQFKTVPLDQDCQKVGDIYGR